MSPRQRNPLNSRLPANLSLHKTGQYRYTRPDNKRDHYLGMDRDAAIAAAQKLNAILIPANNLVDKVLQLEHRLSEAVALFRRESIPQRHWKPNTLKEYQFRLRRIESDLGEEVLETLTVKRCAEFLREVTHGLRAREQYRTMLVQVLDCAVQEGWLANNVAKATKVAKAQRRRARLTLDAYRTIHAIAEPWLQNAMDLSLHTLLRRADIAAMRFEDIRDGFLYVIPRKTETTSYVRMKIRLLGELARVVDRCRDGLVSPYLVHRLPIALRPHGQRAKGREHHLQVLPEDISRGFNRALKRSGLAYGEATPPTFHEIRSLGGDLYRQAGWSLDAIQELMGHASETMTQHYLKGHEAPWKEVRAGLELGS